MYKDKRFVDINRSTQHLNILTQLTTLVSIVGHGRCRRLHLLQEVNKSSRPDLLQAEPVAPFPAEEQSDLRRTLKQTGTILPAHGCNFGVLASRNNPSASAKFDFCSHRALAGEGLRICDHFLRRIWRRFVVRVATEGAQSSKVSTKKRSKYFRKSMHLSSVTLALLWCLRGIPILSAQG